MTDALVEAVARAILETDSTCDYDACKVRVETNPHSNDANWWASLHRQARNALAAIEASGTHVLVPVEPTPSMRAACRGYDDPRMAYAAILAARPEQW